MLVFLYGTDSFRSREELAAIKNKFLNDNNSGANLSVIDFEDDPQKKLSSVINSGGLFSVNQLVIAKNIIANAKKETQDEVVEYLQSRKNIISDKNATVVFWEGNLPKKNNRLFRFLEKQAKSRNFEVLKGVSLEKWIIERVQKENSSVAIDKNALNKLIAYTNGDLFLIMGEISKLSNFKEDGVIEEKDVEAVVKAKIKANIFETIEALSNGNKSTALALLHNQIQEGDDLFYILSMYIYQFRNLLKVSEFSGQGVSDRYLIAKETGLHPYVAQKALEQLRKFKGSALKCIYKKLQKLDTEVKTGKIEIKMALDKFVVEL